MAEINSICPQLGFLIQFSSRNIATLPLNAEDMCSWAKENIPHYSNLSQTLEACCYYDDLPDELSAEEHGVNSEGERQSSQRAAHPSHHLPRKRRRRFLDMSSSQKTPKETVTDEDSANTGHFLGTQTGADCSIAHDSNNARSKI